MVANGGATVANPNGKVKSIQLLESAGTRLERIGDPDAAARFGARFYRWVRLDCGARIVERHPRSFDYE